ncbi:MAG: hypothetical protein ABR563_16775 [Pyrinomonadaceae bacterium]
MPIKVSMIQTKRIMPSSRMSMLGLLFNDSTHGTPKTTSAKSAGTRTPTLRARREWRRRSSQ